MAEALQRLKERHDAIKLGSPVGDPLVSLAEVLTWLYALEEHHRKADANFYDARNKSAGGMTEAGLIYARNLITHQLADVARLVAHPGNLLMAQRRMRGRRHGSVSIMPPVREYRWHPLGDLPPPDEPETYGRDAMYEAYVADREMIQPLEDALTFMTGRGDP